MNTAFFLTLLLTPYANAQNPTMDPGTTQDAPAIIQMDGKHFCQMMNGEMPKICDQDLNQKRTVMLRLAPLDAEVYQPWAIRLYFGNGNTIYKPTTMTLKSSRLDVTIQGVEGRQRNGYQYFKFWENKPKDALRWIDEPTNNLKIVFDKKNHQFFLSINHPKVIYANNNSEPNLNRNVMVQGTVDGIAVNGYMPINQKFDGYNAQPGEMNITRLENSWMFMQYEVGYGYAIPLIQTRHAGRIVFTPQVQGGIFMGPENSSMIKKGEYWEYDNYRSTNYHVMGPTITGAARLEWQSPNQRFGLFSEYRNSIGHLKYPFQDGTIEHDIRYQSITFGLSASLRMRKK